MANRNRNKRAQNAKKNQNRQAVVRYQEPPTTVTMLPPKTRKQPSASNVILAPRFRSRRGAKGRGSNPGVPSLPPFITAYVDPWSVDSDGVRYPDSFRGLSGAFSSVYEQRIVTSKAAGGYTDPNMALATPAPGSALFLLTPDPSNMLVTGVFGSNSGDILSTVNNMFTWPNGIAFNDEAKSLNAFGPGTGMTNSDNVLANLSALRAMYSGARLVAGGARITTTMNFSTVSGVIHMAPVFVNMSRETTNGTDQNHGDPTGGEMMNGWQTALPLSLGNLVNLPGYVEYPLSALESDEMVAVFKRFGDEALAFKPTQSTWGLDDGNTGDLTKRYGTQNVPNSYGHYCICVCIEGVLKADGSSPAPDVPLVEVEMKLHYEGQQNPSSAMGLALNTNQAAFNTCSPSPQFQPILLAAADNICVEVPPIRCVDDAGVEELGFLDEVARLWKSSVKVASSVATAVSVASGMLSAMAL